MKKAKTAWVVVLLCTALAAAAQAVEIVCVEERALGADYEYSVMRATLDNGQVIHYLSHDDDGWYQMEDVNFDGYEDFTPVTTRGASNFFSSFFLYNPQSGRYEPVYTGTLGLCNYTLMPQEGYVVSSVNDGWRDGEKLIYQWQDGTLILLRRGTVRGVDTVEFTERGMIERWDFSRYEMLIYDYTAGQEGGTLIYQETYPDDDTQHEEHLALFEARLWEGL